MSAKRKPAAGAKEKPTYEATEKERVILQDFLAQYKASLPTARIKIADKASGRSVGIDHPDQIIGQAIMSKAIGSVQIGFLNGVLVQAGNAGLDLKSYGGEEFIVATMQGLEPRNEAEGMLIMQMATVHMASMMAAAGLARADVMPKFECYERAFNRLTRTYAVQVEALARLRGGGKQVVEVRRYDVRGNNVVVGDVHQGGGGGVRRENPGQPHVPGALGFDPGPEIPSMWGEDAGRDSLPVAGGGGAEAVSDARGTIARGGHGRG
jgi:hypothetical protein